MNSSRTNRSAALLTLAFRPFFLLGSLWAVVSITLWMGMLHGGLVLPSRFDPLSWHIHEMLFGWILAAVAGFLLTAIPYWTGRPPVRGAMLGVMTRVSLGHTGRPLSADRATAFIYVAVSAAALCRIAAALMPVPLLLGLSAAFWIAAFLSFVLRYGPLLLRPRLN